MLVKFKLLFVLAILLMGGYYLYSQKPQSQNSLQKSQSTSSPTPYPDTKSAIQAFLANKYKKPVSEVEVVVTKEIQGFASGTVKFGQGGPGEVGAWLAVLGNGWEVVWDGNGNVDCNKMRTQYGFPDTILKPNFCN